MNPKSILAAIREKERWLERRERLDRELKTVQSTKKKLLRELGEVKERISQLDEVLARLGMKRVGARSTSESGQIM